MKKVMTIFGTRPEMIKMWSVLNALDNSNFEHIMVHTGQNYTPELKVCVLSSGVEVCVLYSGVESVCIILRS